MSNLLQIDKNASNTSLPTFVQLLDSLGFSEWLTVMFSFALPSISLLGIILCSMSGWLFFQEKFKDPVFFYYRTLCVIYIIHLVHGIPYGLLFSPRYFPQINTYVSSTYLIYYQTMSRFIFHFSDTLQIAILLTRIKIFIPFVRKHFNASPQFISLSLFVTCFLIDLPSAFTLKTQSFGMYYLVSSQMETFYFVSSSEFSLTLVGKIVLGLSNFFLNQLFTLVVGVVLNVVSVFKYKLYLSHKRHDNHENQRLPYALNAQPMVDVVQGVNVLVVVVAARRHEFSLKEKNDRKAESNMFYMALTLCSINICSRILFMICYVCFFFFYSFKSSLTLALILYSIFTLVPTTSIFVFYSFNKIFREEFNEKILRKLIKKR
jgi:hypothetical protein